jgi:hypothetical protein
MKTDHVGTLNILPHHTEDIANVRSFSGADLIAVYPHTLKADQLSTLNTALNCIELIIAKASWLTHDESSVSVKGACSCQRCWNGAERRLDGDRMR